MDKAPKNDTEYVDEILNFLRYHFQAQYTGYDTWIGRKNMLEHVAMICKHNVQLSERMDMIDNLLHGEFE